MKKSIIFTVLMALAMGGFAQQIHYDFAETIESGQTLYFLKGYYGPQDVMVTYPCYHDTIIYNSSGASTQITTYYYGHDEPSGDLVIPSTITHNDTVYTITTISRNAFWKCTNITSLTLPNTLNSIIQGAFAGCTGITGEVVIPNSVTHLGADAFRSCTSLNSVVFSDALTKIGWAAFKGCSSLEHISPLPESLTRIYDEAFEGCSNLSGTIVIPSQITQIDENVFAYCNISSVVIPESVERIKRMAFASCPLDSIFIPSSVTSISVTDGNGSGAFLGCTHLQSIIVDEANSVYDSRDNCNALIETATNTIILGCKNTIIPNTVNSIGNSAFAGCTELDAITIPNSVSHLGIGAFERCDSLSTITLPTSVSYISNYALACSGLTSIICKSSTPPTAFFEYGYYYSNSFGNEVSWVNREIPIHIPFGCTNAYQNAEGWNYFSNFIEEEPIIYRDFEPDTVLNVALQPDDIRIDFDNDGVPDVNMNWYQQSPAIYVELGSCNPNVKVCYDVEEGDTISSQNDWNMGTPYPQLYEHYGVRLEKDGRYYYGWFRVYAILTGQKKLCFDKFAFCTIPDYPLRWGQTSLDPIGEDCAEWYYEILNPDGSITYQHLQCVGDTLFEDGKRPKIIIRSNTQYDKDLHTEVTHEYIYEENGKVYWWNKQLQQFTTLYNYAAEIGDEWEILVGTEKLTMHVDAVENIEYEGNPYTMLRVSDAEGLFSGDIVCGIGHLTSFFPERLMNRGKNYRVEGMRCYWVDGELVFKHGDEDCDEIYLQLHNGIEENGASTGSGTFMVYPNPANDILVVEMFPETSLYTYRITNLMGQALLQGNLNAENQQIDIKSLPAGMYFITIGEMTQKFVVK